MELHLRLIGGTGDPIDVHLDVADDLLVGELADELARRIDAPPGSSILTRWPRHARRPPPGRAALVSADGPPAGATVSLVPAPDRSVETAELAPAAVVDPDGSRRQLSYGDNRLGPMSLDVTDAVVARPVGHATVLVNGERVLGGRRLTSGDLLSAGGHLQEIVVEGPLHPPPRTGPTVLHDRTPWRTEHHEPTTIDLPTPPAPIRRPGFPVLSATVPLLMGAALWAATRSIAAVVFVLFSFVFVVASGVESRRESNAERRFRLRQHQLELDAARQRIDELHRAQRRRAERAASPGCNRDRLLAGDATHLWQVCDGSLVVRIGSGEVPSEDSVTVPTSGQLALREELAALARRASSFDGPVLADLRETGGLVVVGPDALATSLARSLVAQSALRLSPDELRIEVLTGPGRADRWRWTDWLPHRSAASTGLRLVVADEVDPTTLERHLDRGAPALLVWLAASEAGAPVHVGGVVRVGDGDAELLLRTSTGGYARQALAQLDMLGADEAELVARCVAPYRTRRPDDAADGLVTLRDVLDDPLLVDQPERVLSRWRRCSTPQLAAPIGRSGPTEVHLDLVADGPHALVAGTTGAGKSELLRTLVASLSLLHPPDRVTFLLVDYKGGAAFGPLRTLPHTVGMITDLDEVLAQRALTSLRAEIRRREETLAAHAVSDLTDLGDVGGRPPALVVVVDEFATLARELPDFVDGLVDVAQRGRSLGVHLVLATQRPAGVVSDAIRANTTLRIALRVADEDDSRDVVDVPDAARIRRDQPGRAIVRAGPSECVTIRTAHTGASTVPPPRIRDLAGGPTTGGDLPSGPASVADPAPGEDELTAVVATVSTAARASGASPPRRPWLEPLGPLVAPEALDTTGGTHDDGERVGGRMALGLVDRPDRQCREPLVVDLDRDGGVLVCGAGGSGRTTALLSLAWGASRLDGPIAAHLVGDVRRTAACAEWLLDDALDAHDVERVLRLLRRVDEELTEGRSAGAPRRLVMVDDIAGFEEVHERVNRGEAIEVLTRLARTGRVDRVHVAVSAHRPSEVPVSLRGALGAVIHLRPSDPDEAAMVGLGAWTADPEQPPGRAFVQGHPAQLVLPPAAAVGAGATRHRERIERLPRRVDLERLTSAGPELCPVVGVDADRLAPARLDLRHHHGLVVGPPRWGRSHALAVVASGFQRSFLLAARAGDAVATAWSASHALDTPGSGDWRALVDAAVAAGASAPALLGVDDLPELLDGAEGDEIEQRLCDALSSSRGSRLRLVATGEVDTLTRTYGELVTRLRAQRTGLVLGGDPDVHASLLHAQVPLRQDVPDAPGRGWLLGAGRAQLVQIG